MHIPLRFMLTLRKVRLMWVRRTALLAHFRPRLTVLSLYDRASRNGRISGYVSRLLPTRVLAMLIHGAVIDPVLHDRTPRIRRDTDPHIRHSRCHFRFSVCVCSERYRRVLTRAQDVWRWMRSQGSLALSCSGLSRLSCNCVFMLYTGVVEG